MFALTLFQFAPACSDPDSGTEDSKPPEGNAAHFVLDGDVSGLSLSLTQVEPTSIGGEELSYGQAVTSVAAEAELDIDLDGLDPGSLANLEGVQVSMFVPALHLDSDGDGAPSASEGYLGAGLTWLVYVEGDPSGIMALSGAVEGWNALNRDVTHESFTGAGDLAAVALSASLVVSEEIELGGSWTDTVPDATGIALLSRVARNGGTVADSTLYDAAATDPWTVAVSGAPPEDHYESLDSGASGAVEVGLVYSDLDGSGALNRADDALYGLCADGTAVGIVYYPLVSQLSLALLLTETHNGAGWSGFAFEGGGRPVPPEELGSLTTGPDCALPSE